MAGLNGDSNILKILSLYIVLAKITAMSDFKNGVISCVCVKLDGTSVCTGQLCKELSLP